MRKKGAASAPQPATHCQLALLLARSASTSVSQNQRLAVAPVDAQMLDQQAGHDHAHPVVHPAGLPQLAHAGIDDGNAGLARVQASKSFCAFAPCEFGEALVQRLGGQLADCGTEAGRRIPASPVPSERSRCHRSWPCVRAPHARSGAARFRPNADAATGARCRRDREGRGRCHSRRHRPGNHTARHARPSRPASSQSLSPSRAWSGSSFQSFSVSLLTVWRMSACAAQGCGLSTSICAHRLPEGREDAKRLAAASWSSAPRAHAAARH